MRDRFLASIRDRLGTAAVKGQALDLCQELFLADGARSDEEDAVLQNLRELLELPALKPGFSTRRRLCSLQTISLPVLAGFSRKKSRSRRCNVTLVLRSPR